MLGRYLTNLKAQGLEVWHNSGLNHVGVALVGRCGQRGTGGAQPLLNIVCELEQSVRMCVLGQLQLFCFSFHAFFLIPLILEPNLVECFLCLAVAGSVDGELGGNPFTFTLSIYLQVENRIVKTIFLLQAACYHFYPPVRNNK